MHGSNVLYLIFNVDTKQDLLLRQPITVLFFLIL